MSEAMESSSDSDRTNEDPSDIVSNAKISFYSKENSLCIQDDNMLSSDDTVIVSETSTDLTKSESGNSLNYGLLNETNSSSFEGMKQNKPPTIYSDKEDNGNVDNLSPNSNDMQINDTNVINFDIGNDKLSNEKELIAEMIESLSSPKSPIFEKAIDEINNCGSKEDVLYKKLTSPHRTDSFDVNCTYKESNNVDEDISKDCNNYNCSNANRVLDGNGTIKKEDTRNVRSIKESDEKGSFDVCDPDRSKGKAAKNHVVISSDEDDASQSDIIEVDSSDDDVEVISQKNDKTRNNHHEIKAHGSSPYYDVNIANLIFDEGKDFHCAGQNHCTSLSVSSTDELFMYKKPSFQDPLCLSNYLNKTSKEENVSSSQYIPYMSYVDGSKVSSISTHGNLHKDNSLFNDQNIHLKCKNNEYPSDNGNHISKLRSSLNKGCASENPIDIDKNNGIYLCSIVPNDSTSDLDNISGKTGAKKSNEYKYSTKSVEELYRKESKMDGDSSSNDQLENIDILIDIINKQNDDSSEKNIDQDTRDKLQTNLNENEVVTDETDQNPSFCVGKDKNDNSLSMNTSVLKESLSNISKNETIKSKCNIIGPQAYPKNIVCPTIAHNFEDIDKIEKKKRKRKKYDFDNRSMAVCLNTFNEVLTPKNKLNEKKMIVDSNLFEAKDLTQSTNGNKTEKICTNHENELQSNLGSLKVVNESVVESTDLSGMETNLLEVHSFTTLQNPILVGRSYQEFESKPENHLRGCLWSPDGSCVLTNSDDNILRIFNVPENIMDETLEDELIAALRMNEGETVYDIDWYPFMNSQNPDTCLFLSTSRDHPIHLWDSYNGEIRCTYKAHNQLDELASAHCVSFNPDGSKIYCGFDKCIRVFDSSRPGIECIERNTDGKINQPRKGKPKRILCQPGIISTIAFSTYSGLYALGSFSRTIGLYDTNDGKAVSVLSDHSGGVTQVKFTNDGYYLISGARKDSEIIWWDLRNTSLPLFKLLRNVSTNQRIQFDIDRNNLNVFSGSTDNQVHIWDLKKLPDEIQDDVISYDPTYKFYAHNDAVNAVCLHPTKPVLATTSGQRHFYEDSDSDSDSNLTVQESRQHLHDNSLKLWKL